MKVPEQYRITKEFAESLSWTGISRPSIYRNLADDFPEGLISDSSYGNNGTFFLPREGKKVGRFFFAQVSDYEGWEHVSISIPSEKRCPTWEEMCYIKDFFWDKNETVMQLHPPESDYVNNHQFCLHLWRPVDQNIPIPHSLLVGFKKS